MLVIHLGMSPTFGKLRLTASLTYGNITKHTTVFSRVLAQLPLAQTAHQTTTFTLAMYNHPPQPHPSRGTLKPSMVILARLVAMMLTSAKILAALSITTPCTCSTTTQPT